MQKSSPKCGLKYILNIVLKNKITHFILSKIYRDIMSILFIIYILYKNIDLRALTEV